MFRPMLLPTSIPLHPRGERYEQSRGIHNTTGYLGHIIAFPSTSTAEIVHDDEETVTR